MFKTESGAVWVANRWEKWIAVVLMAATLAISMPVGAAGLQAPERAKPATVGQTGGSSYRLSKYDVLNIVIVGFSDANGFSNIMIGPDGYVNLPYAGTVKLAGLTVPEASALLTQKLGEYIKIPSLALMIKQYGPRKVYVMGSVAKQGLYELGMDYMNVFAAISAAGGITNKGRPKHIAVVRMVDGKMQVYEVNFDRFIKDHDASQNMALQDGDMVYVPESNKIDLNTDIMPLVNSFMTLKVLTQ
jgi:polysaccharide export outer membrane protein